VTREAADAPSDPLPCMRRWPGRIPCSAAPSCGGGACGLALCSYMWRRGLWYGVWAAKHETPRHHPGSPAPPCGGRMAVVGQDLVAAVWRWDGAPTMMCCAGGCGLPNGYPLPIHVAGVGKFETRYGWRVRVTGDFNPSGCECVLVPPPGPTSRSTHSHTHKGKGRQGGGTCPSMQGVGPCPSI
jgi:hypothetical protein